ncbi:MAG: Cell division protein ftsA [Parcubacteria group bacterium GW2011_GWA2_44_12]|nr:MAG: Cell division protein ftsA [Parcubacteria group bacterium GW2011_GWA2_44_12]
MKKKIIAGIDIGSTFIRVVVGQAGEHGLSIIGLAEVDSDGVSKGVITSIEDAVSRISQALEKAERMTGVPIESAVVSISGNHIVSHMSKGVIAVSRANGEINEEDVDRAIEAAQTVSIPPNYEILHVIPRQFSVDNQPGIKDPIGMTGIRLEVSAQIIQGLSAQIKNLTKTIYRTGVDVDDVVVAGLATAEAVLSRRQKELGVCVFNIGGATTSLSVFEEGDIIHTAVIPVGSSHITSDIAIGLRTSLDTAEEIKFRYGTALPETVDRREDLNLEDISKHDTGVVSKHHIAEIIEARVEEIFKLADRELVKIERSGKLPAGVILTGGGAKLEGTIELARKIFRLPASLGYPREVPSAIDKVNDPSLTCGVGLVVWGYNSLSSENSRKRLMPSFASTSQVTKKLQKWFKSLLP